MSAEIAKSPGKDRRQRRSKIAIRQAFLQLLSEKDLSEITVKEIADRADRDRKTFYLHYGCIDDLIDEILQEEAEEEVAIIRQFSLGSDGLVDVHKLYTVLGDQIVRRLNERSAPLKHVKTSDLIMRLKPLLTKVLAEDDSLGLGKSLGPHLDLFVAYFCAALLQLYTQWLEGDSELPAEQLSELAVATTFGGINALIAAAETMGLGKK